MHITVFCPHCQSRYQLDPSLRGKRMRCPNTICRMIFEVREEGEAPPPPPPKPEEPAPAKPVFSGTVGEVVPVLSAEAVSPEALHPEPGVVQEAGPDLVPPPVRRPPIKMPEPARPPEPVPPEAKPDPLIAREPAAAIIPPPVRKPPPKKPEFATVPEPAKPGVEEKDDSFPDDLGIPGDDEGSPESSPEKDEGPHEVRPGTWEAPPVRGAPTIGLREEPVVSAPAPATLPEPEPMPPARGSRRRSLVLIFTMLLVLGAALGAGVYLVSGRGEVNEAERFKKAQELYQNQEFEEAVGAFQKLLREFPTSKNRRQYDFLVELSSVRAAVYAPLNNPDERAGALGSVLQFLTIYKNDPVLKEYHGDIWHTLQRLARELTALAEKNQDADVLAKAKRSWEEAGRFTRPKDVKISDAAISADFARVENMLAARAARLELLEELQEKVTLGSADAVREGRALVKGAALEQDPEVVPLLAKLVEAHRAKIVFTPAARNSTGGLSPRSPGSAEDVLPSFYVTPQVGKVYPDSKQAGVVLAQARGVLYALDAARGTVHWVRRVGVDTSVLPLRVPASTLLPEMVLVLSSDSKSVSAVAADTGALVWQHTIDDVCLGRPVLVDHHLLVPTLSGRVEEIETTGGVLQGSYALGQPLVVGGVQQPETTLAIFPADQYSVYILDVAKRACAAILYSDHAPGSLRGLPLAWTEESAPGDKGNANGWLLLNLASGGDSVEMRPYALPIRQPDQKPADLKTGGKNPQGVDTSLKVRGNTWTAPWHDGEKLALATDAGLLALYGIRQQGNRDALLFPLLKDDYRVESVDRGRRSRPLVVHADAENYWVLTAGKLHRLQATFTAAAGPGLVARWPQPVDVGSPLHEGQVHVGADGKTTIILVTQDLGQPACWVRAVDADQGKVLWQRQLGMVCQDQLVAAGDAVLGARASGVFLFEAARFAADKSWQPAGTLFDSTGKATSHWTSARGTGFVHLAWGPEAALQVLLVDGKGAPAPRSVPLPAPPVGTPALGSDFVLLPLANGIVVRVPLAEGTPTDGPHWRGVGVEESQPGHIVALGDNEFALTDGGRSLMRIHWGEAKIWEKRGGTEMPHRITAAPAVLGKRLLVADASDTVTLLEGVRLQPARRWSLSGRISAGPFVRAEGVGVVVGKTRLVWLDPGKDKAAWEYICVAPIVGQPELVENLLVVADLQGGIVGLNLATGNPAGAGYRLKANEAPTAAPLPFGPGQVFMPLMDGTGMVLPLKMLR